MKSFQGTVVSLKNKNTAVVKVNTLKAHSRYKKVIKSTKNFQVHYGNDVVLSINERVIIKPSRPFSLTKRFVVVKKQED